MVPFSEDELKVVGTHMQPKSMRWFRHDVLQYNSPITSKENIARCISRKEPLWFPMLEELLNLESRTNIDHIARAEVMDMGDPLPLEEKGGKDLFGIEWVYVPEVMGSMVRPGNPALDDANNWPQVIKFPDIDALDWDECKKLNSCMSDTTLTLQMTIQNGLFERLISFMDFENAIMAIFDEDQKEAVHALFDKLADMYISIIDHYLDCVKLDGIMFHDDWGSQRAPFFSLDLCMEMIVPHMKRISDHCHKRGIYFQLHCCGKNEQLVPAMIAAGVDYWHPQPMNDIDMLRETYGDKIMFCIAPPVLGTDATDEEIDAAAKAFVEKYAPTFAEKPFIVSSFFTDPRFRLPIYKYSRMALSK